MTYLWGSHFMNATFHAFPFCKGFISLKKSLWKNLMNNKFVESNIVIYQNDFVFTYLPSKKLHQSFFLQTLLPHPPSPSHLHFFLCKKILSHACKPILGSAFPKWGIPNIWGIHFAMGKNLFWIHKTVQIFSQSISSFLQWNDFKTSHPFCHGFFFKHPIFFSMDFLGQTVHPFCNGFLGKHVAFFSNTFLQRSS